MNKAMKIVFFGSAQFGIPCLDAINASEHQLVAIFTQPAHPAGRGRKPRPTPVAEWAGANNIPCTEAENINTPDMVAAVADCKADLLVVIAFGQKIGTEVIDLHPKGAINVHASLLPKYRGAAPINWVLANGESETGITIITLAEKMDAGDMLAKASITLTAEDDAQTVHDRLSQISPDTLMQTIDQIADGTAIYTPQDHSIATLAQKMKKSDGFIDFNDPAEKIVNQVRAFWPWPGAHAEYVSAAASKSIQVIIAKAEVIKAAEPKGPNGTLDEDLNIICGSDRLKIHQIKPSGKAVMDFKAFVNGRNTKPGDIFKHIDKAI